MQIGSCHNLEKVTAPSDRCRPGIRCYSGPCVLGQPRWTGPYTGVLTTPTAAKLSGLEPWYHITRLKQAPPPHSWPPRKRSRLRLGSKGFTRTHIPVLSNGAHKTKNLPDSLPTSGQRMTGTSYCLFSSVRPTGDLMTWLRRGKSRPGKWETLATAPGGLSPNIPREGSDTSKQSTAGTKWLTTL